MILINAYLRELIFYLSIANLSIEIFAFPPLPSKTNSRREWYRTYSLLSKKTTANPNVPN